MPPPALAPPTKRRKRSTALVEDDVEAAEAVTHTKITHITRSGTRRTKTVLVPLVPLVEKEEKPSRAPIDEIENNYEMPDLGEADPPPKSSKVDAIISVDVIYPILMWLYPKKQRDYVKQFADRVSDLLQATLSREFWPEEQQKCTECSEGNWAVWRCIDCTLSHPICWHCMRHTHRRSPFHRIECWTGLYFRRGALWEVGTYILVEHHRNILVCEGLKFQIGFLERLQVKKDHEEQEKISNMVRRSASASASASASTAWCADDNVDSRGEEFQDLDEDQEEQGAMNDVNFFHWLDVCHENGTQLNDVGQGDAMDGTDSDNGDAAEADIQGFLPYLDSQARVNHCDAARNGKGNSNGSGEYNDLGHSEMRPVADGLNNTYVRVVHTNGIHHLAMVTCLCHGEDNVPLDLVASRLLPASFTHIRTLFTTPLLDYFRLCNLELKASAYQFYQLIRRLTRPLGNGEIVNLYHEFRRMSRLWRWMKKLKWAGYGHNQQDPLQPPPGSLANYCPTCPQPGVNLPEDWKSDRNRCVIQLSITSI